MQIKIEIDVRPEELRRFLGLPDVSGLQDDVIAFLRDKIGAAGEFDATGFLKHNIENLRQNPAWQKLVARVRLAETVDEVAAAALQASTAPTAKKAAKKAARTPSKRGRRRRAA